MMHAGKGKFTIANVLTLLVLGALGLAPGFGQNPTVAPITPPKAQFFSATGTPFTSGGGKLCSYQAGTLVPQATYTDSTGAVLNTDPVILDAGGFANVWLDVTLKYKFVLLSAGTDNSCSTGSVQWTVDNYQPIATGALTNPMNGAGQLVSSNAAAAPVRVNGNITVLPMVLQSTGNGTSAGLPVFSNPQVGNNTTIIDITVGATSVSPDVCAEFNTAFAAHPTAKEFTGRGVSGSPTCATTAIPPHEIIMDWPAAAVTATACPAITLNSYDTLNFPPLMFGTGGYIQDNGCAAGIINTISAAVNATVNYGSVAGNSYVNTSGTPVNGGFVAGSSGIDFSGCAESCISNYTEAGAVETGFKIGGYYDQINSPTFYYTANGIYCSTFFSGGSFRECNSSQFKGSVQANGPVRYGVYVQGAYDFFDHIDIEAGDIPLTGTASFVWGSNLVTVSGFTHGLSNGNWVYLYSASAGLTTGSQPCQITVLSSTSFTCVVGAGSGSGSDMDVDPSTTYYIYGSNNGVYNNYTESQGIFNYNVDPTGVLLTAVAKSGSTISFTTVAPLPASYFPTTFAMAPTAGGSAYTAADLGAVFTTSCGATGYITGVTGGAVTAIYSAGAGAYGCTTGPGQTTTGGHGTGLTVNISAFPALTVGIYSPLAGGGNNWDNTCNGQFTATPTSATTFTVTNSSCSTFTPNSVGYVSGSFVSSLNAGADFFLGGTNLTGFGPDIRNPVGLQWYTNDTHHNQYGSPFTTNKLGLVNGASPAFIEGVGGNTTLLQCRNSTDTGNCTFLANLQTINAASNCVSAASPAVCGSAATGAVNIATSASSVVVDTTAVTATSRITVTFDSSLGGELSVTCNTTAQQPYVSSRSAGGGFTVSVPATFAVNPGCINYTIVNGPN